MKRFKIFAGTFGKEEGGERIG